MEKSERLGKVVKVLKFAIAENFETKRGFYCYVTMPVCRIALDLVLRPSGCLPPVTGKA